MKTALIQFTAGEDPTANLTIVRSMVQDAAKAGARFVLTPEVSNVLSSSRRYQAQVLQQQADDPFLSTMLSEAKALGIWLLVGSLALKTGDADGRFANRSFLISPDGVIQARYDKIHMFDVEIDETETYRESAAYRPGTQAVLADTPFGKSA